MGKCVPWSSCGKPVECETVWLYTVRITVVTYRSSSVWQSASFCPISVSICLVPADHRNEMTQKLSLGTIRYNSVSNVGNVKGILQRIWSTDINVEIIHVFLINHFLCSDILFSIHWHCSTTKVWKWESNHKWHTVWHVLWRTVAHKTIFICLKVWWSSECSQSWWANYND